MTSFDQREGPHLAALCFSPHARHEPVLHTPGVIRILLRHRPQESFFLEDDERSQAHCSSQKDRVSGRGPTGEQGDARQDPEATHRVTHDCKRPIIHNPEVGGFADCVRPPHPGHDAHRQADEARRQQLGHHERLTLRHHQTAEHVADWQQHRPPAAINRLRRSHVRQRQAHGLELR